MKSISHQTGIALLALGLGQQVLAAPNDEIDEKLIEEVVVRGELSRFSATKSDTPILEVSRSISIENQQDILDKGALTLADTYLYSAGVTGEQYGFATRGDWLAVRGLSAPEYRDSLQALFGSYNNARPDVYTIEQVEILKGPVSVLYGKGSPGGIVNIVSKTPKAEAQHEVVLELGNYHRQQIGFDSTGPLTEQGDWLYRVVALYRDTDSQVDFVGDEVVNLAPSLTWKPSEAGSITLLLNYKDSKADVGSQFLPVYGTLLPAPNGQYVDWGLYTGEPEFNRYNTKSKSATLLGDYRFNDIWSVEATVRRTDGDSDYAQAWTSFIGGDRYIRNPDGSLYESGTVPRTFYVAKGKSDQFAIDTRFKADFQIGSATHDLMIGVQYQDVETDTDSAYLFGIGLDFTTGLPDSTFGDTFWINVFDPVYGTYPDAASIAPFFNDTPASTTEDFGLYINDQIDIDRWSISLGVRYDEVENDNGTSIQEDDATSVSVGALYAFDSGISPYINFAESFEPVVGTDGITGDNLKPREGEQVEAGIKYQPQGSGAFITLAVFDIEQSNLSNPNALVGANSQQEGVSEVEGVELEAYIPVGDFTVELNASQLDTKDPNGFQFASIPEKQASAWIGYKPAEFFPGLKAGLGLRYAGESFDGTDTLKTPSYTVADLMLGYEINEWIFSLNVQNLADKEYISTCLARGDCFLGERRSVVGRVRYQF